MKYTSNSKWCYANQVTLRGKKVKCFLKLTYKCVSSKKLRYNLKRLVKPLVNINVELFISSPPPLPRRHAALIHKRINNQGKRIIWGTPYTVI
jgi:hypothetical protein